MDDTRSKAKRQFAVVHLDGIIILSRTVEVPFCHVWTVMGLKSRAGESLKLKKGLSLDDSADHLSHVVQTCQFNISKKGRPGSRNTTHYERD